MKSENEQLRELILFLWELLDNIDTLDDACKDNDKAFRNMTRKQQQKRWKTGITTDGYAVNINTGLKL